ncbi:hypothetical protein GCM10027020_08320 [Nocardioides salsibiostraticola]
MIETEVKGSTTSVDSAATWLRDSLKTQVDNASEDVLAAKRKAERHWEGSSGRAYVGYVKDIIQVSDAHVDRIETAAGEIEAYSARLKQAQERMKALRVEARAGGLGVVGTVIQTPPDAVAPTPPALDAPDADRTRFTDDMGAFQAKVEKIELYNRILGDVELEWSNFLEWIDANLKPAPKALEAPEVDKLATFVRENVGNLGIAFGLTLGERSLLNKTEALRAEAKELRDARRSGNPARQARGNAPEAPGRIKDLNRYADWAGRGGRILGPVGAAWDTYQALEGESPGGGLLAVAAGAGATALVIATAPVSVPTVVVVGGAVVVGAGVTWAVTEGWDALPDDFTEPVDEWVGDRWDDTKGALSDGWGAVTGWL